ncbi:hypothetical protein PGT21_004814 [Puccinia graminis f. sp. tritici]|uniref:Uncharacterized protein n=1 Tax=Puccinia graminis f. sp. tritici TaxID=56615 RepID=A0A5B0M6A9_PUCGR|nr:hypothetical protein PGT21_004814 [Puccinia graminis f. sp. tritici]
MNHQSGSGGWKSKYGRLKGRHVKRTTNSSASDATEDSVETTELRECLASNLSGPACQNVTRIMEAPSSASSVLEANKSNNTNNTGALATASLAPNNTTNIVPSTSPPIGPNNATTTAAPPGEVARDNRLGWKIGLAAPLLVILLIIGLAFRHKRAKKLSMREKWQELSIPQEVVGEKRQEPEPESQKKTNAIQPRGNREESLQTEEILSAPARSKRKEPSHQEMLDLERGTPAVSVRQGDEEDNRSRKSSVVSRFSLRSFSLRPAMDMSIFQARNDAPLDTFQLEIKHRERLSKANLCAQVTYIDVPSDSRCKYIIRLQYLRPPLSS